MNRRRRRRILLRIRRKHRADHAYQFQRLIPNTWRGAVTFRTYGAHGEFRRPMFHRWSVDKIKGATTMSSLIMVNICNSSPLIRAMLKAGA